MSSSPAFTQSPKPWSRALCLESEGLFAVVPDFNILGAEFDPALTSTGYRLLVREEDEVQAREILEAAQSET